MVPGTKSVLFVANNWDGTADIVDPQTFAKLGRLDVIPDLEARLREIALDPRRLGFFVGVRALIGEGNDQYADDMFSSHDGRFVFTSPGPAWPTSSRSTCAPGRSSGASR